MTLLTRRPDVAEVGIAPARLAQPAAGHGWWRHIAVRLLQMLPTLLLILLVAFILLQLAPGDMVQVLAGEAGGASPETLAHLRASFGMNQPLYLQFVHYAGGILHGDLGFSYRNNMPVADLLLTRLPATILLSCAALVVSVLLGVAGGAIAASYRGRWPDHLVSLLALLIYATPVFLVGVALILVFSVALVWLPIGGFPAASEAASAGAYALSLALHLILPAITLGTAYAAIYMRLTRGAMLEIMGLDFIRTARAKGLSPWRIVWRHALRNALLPLVTAVGIQTGSMLSGAILVETVFSWPGIGRLAFEALQQRDYNVLAGVILCSGTLVLLVNLLVDLLYTALDPRVRIR